MLKKLTKLHLMVNKLKGETPQKIVELPKLNIFIVFNKMFQQIIIKTRCLHKIFLKNKLYRFIYIKVNYAVTHHT